MWMLADEYHPLCVQRAFVSIVRFVRVIYSYVSGLLRLFDSKGSEDLK